MTKRSVLQDWLLDISTRQQGVLIIATRGPDGVRKEDAAKPLVRTIRALIMNAGRTGEPIPADTKWEDDPFMTKYWIGNEDRWADVTKEFFNQWDAYNIHYLQHLMHAYQVLGASYPDITIAIRCWSFYQRCVKKLHVNEESAEEMRYRLRDGIRKEDGTPD